MILILCGFPFAGKTTWGEKVAKKLEIPFFDSDRLLEKKYKEKTGIFLSCREIFRKDGEEKFRSLEEEAIHDFSFPETCILSLGGGVLDSKRNQKKMRKLGLIIYLKVSKEILFQRITSAPTLPAYLDPSDLEGSFEKLFEKRRYTYETTCDHEVSLEQADDEMIQLLCEIGSVKSYG